MENMWQTILVILIVSAAAAFIARYLWRRIGTAGRTATVCENGCQICGENAQCPEGCQPPGIINPGNP
jgi:hypothetical protein